jgi:[ribosomal protein S5]-alanine N-acetyltransferase
LELTTSRCTLRSWQWSDLESLVHHANNRKIWINVRDRFPFPYTKDDAERWLAFARSSHPDTNFAIVVERKAVGGIGFALQEDVHRCSAEVGYWLGEEFWGRGITTAALQAITEYAFANFQICRLYASVFEWNQASCRVLEKAGFVCEGILKRSAVKDGKTIDQFLYATTR